MKKKAILLAVTLAITTTPAIADMRIESNRGISQSEWNNSSTYQNFSCPLGWGRGDGADMNYTTTRSDDYFYAYCIEPVIATSVTPTPISETSTVSNTVNTNTTVTPTILETATVVTNTNTVTTPITTTNTTVTESVTVTQLIQQVTALIALVLRLLLKMGA